VSDQPTPAGAPPIVDRILSGSAPIALRLAAARGALPLPRATLARLYLHLQNDPDESIRTAAATSLGELTPELIIEVLDDPGCDGEVIRHFASRGARDETIAERIAFHANTGPDALAVLATEGTAGVLDLVLTNQKRLIGTPGLIDRLSVNPALRHDQRGRLLDLIDRFVNVEEEADGSVPGDPEMDTVSPEELARFLDVDVGELYASSEIIDGEEFAQSEELVVRSAYKKILMLNTAQKAILAMKGGKEERTILIRDTNKVVSLSVLKNRRLTEQEVESIAAMRNVSDEVLRQVGTNREWAKTYAIMANLVRNPRTPPAISTNFVGRLNPRDIKLIAGDRNVPEIIRKMAKRTIELREQKAAVSFRRK